MKDFEKLDQLLRQAISSNNEPDESLNQKIINQVGERSKMRHVNKKRMSTVAICAMLILSTSISAFAVWKLLTPKQIAENLGNESLAIAFEGEDALAINQAQISGDYKVTLLGIVSGEKISDFESSVDDIVHPNRSYAVVAIANADGTPMPSTHDEAYGETPFFVSPFIKGQNPNRFNIITMNGGYSEFVKDGIMYRIVECDDIEIFADRGLYLGVNSGTFYDANAYHFDLETGKIIPNADYEGVNVLFDLPLDPSKGNPEKAEKYLQTLIDKQSPAQENIDEELIDIEALLAESTLISESVQEVVPNEAGMITYHFEGRKFEISFEFLFEEGQVGLSDKFYIDDDGHVKNILVFSRDTDGVISAMTYRKN